MQNSFEEHIKKMKEDGVEEFTIQTIDYFIPNDSAFYFVRGMSEKYGYTLVRAYDYGHYMVIQRNDEN